MDTLTQTANALISPAPIIKLIGLDLDGTLVATEKYYRQSEHDFFETLKKHNVPLEIIEDAKAEFSSIRKPLIKKYGFGVPLQHAAFLEVTLKKVPSYISSDLLNDINELTDKLRHHPVQFYEGLDTLFNTLYALHMPVIIITKGEHFHQKDKIDILHNYLNVNGILNPIIDAYPTSDKTTKSYYDILKSHNSNFHEFLMIGDSPKSDINPVIEGGGHGILIAHEQEAKVIWDYEQEGHNNSATTCPTLKGLARYLQSQLSQQAKNLFNQNRDWTHNMRSPF